MSKAVGQCQRAIDAAGTGQPVIAGIAIHLEGTGKTGEVGLGMLAARS
jgi:hypothetical protein